MKLKVFVFVLLVLINIEEIKSQNEVLSCDYELIFNSYMCDLTINNPKGLNNFQDINGTHLTGKTDNDVEYIAFASNSNSTNIPSIICEKFKNVLSIDFIYDLSNISELNDYYFVNCIHLEHIFINGYKINNIAKNAFIENINLQDINLSGCGLTDLPANVFPKLGNNLTSLLFYENKLKIMKPGWFKFLTKLEFLDMHENLFEEIPINTFINCKKLNYINLGENNLIVLSSKSFYDVTNIQFNFMSNHLEAIDEKFVYNTVQPFFYELSDNWCINTRPYTRATEDDFITCIKNYRSWETGCTFGNTNERICKLESNSQITTQQIAADFNELRTKVDTLSKENQDLKSKVDLLIVANQAMQNQINFITTRI